MNSLFKPTTSVDNEGGLKSSYSISLNIAKKGKPYIIGEDIIVHAIKDAIECVLKKDPPPVFKCIPLSANSVRRHIEEMANDVEGTISELNICKFAIQLDESTFGSSSIPMAYVRFNSPSLGDTIDEFLFASYLEIDSKSETVFSCLEGYLNKHNVPLENILAVATDGAPAMIGRYRGFSAFIKEKIPAVKTVHCILHKQHLVAKKLSGELHDALKVCIREINRIKAHPVNARLFSRLCETNDETYDQLILHIGIRWLSRGDSLQRLVDFYDSTKEFLTDIDLILCRELQSTKNHLFYLADLYSKCNEIQKRLQGKGVTIIQARTILMGFQTKVGLFKSSLARRQFKYFSNMQVLTESKDISDHDLWIYIEHLNKLNEDLENMNIPEWLITPFNVKMYNNGYKSDIEDELIEMSVDLEAKVLFIKMNLSEYWSNINIITKYPRLSDAAEYYLIAFPSSYMVEVGFSHANAILTKQRNRINLETRGDLRLKLTNFQPDIKSLVAAHQVHSSH